MERYNCPEWLLILDSSTTARTKLATIHQFPNPPSTNFQAYHLLIFNNSTIHQPLTPPLTKPLFHHSPNPCSTHQSLVPPPTSPLLYHPPIHFATHHYHFLYSPIFNSTTHQSFNSKTRKFSILPHEIFNSITSKSPVHYSLCLISPPTH